MSINNAEKHLKYLDTHIRVCDSHDINSCINCIRLITYFLNYVDSLEFGYQSLPSKRKKFIKI